jgi:hypothetical protein
MRLHSVINFRSHFGVARASHIAMKANVIAPIVVGALLIILVQLLAFWLLG